MIKKIIYKVYPTGVFSGNTALISLLYFPTLVLIYGIFITSLEAENYEIIKEIISMSDDKIDSSHYYRDTDSLITNLFNRINEISQNFSLFYPEEKYKFPMNEYLYKYMQPIIDDILFIGDDYNDKYTNTEILISVIYAVKNYSEKDYVWGPFGRYLYILGYGNKEITKLPINEIINNLGIYDELSNKDDFIAKYNNFLSKNFF